MRIRWAEESLADIDRLDAFLRRNSPPAADRAYRTIYDAVLQLSDFPFMGRPLPDGAPGYRELLVSLSGGGYLVLYFVDTQIEILRLRHQREDQY